MPCPYHRSKVLDFGLAKLVRQIRDEVDKEAPTLADITFSGTVLGTASYMSPEQTRGEVLDSRTDIFSLGSVLYEAATRNLPFSGPSLLAIMHAIATLDPQAPSRVRPELSVEFDLIIERALAKDRNRRYATAAEMGEALKVLEDLHWADPSSVDLLRHLCQRLGSQRLLIVGTFRPEDIERTNHPLKSYKAEMQAHKLCEELALDALSLEHVKEYLDATFSPNDFPIELSSLIHEKTEGHPLFATNLLQYLGERGDIARVNSHWSLVRPLREMHLEFPESVRSMIGKKIDTLLEAERRALQYASIEGSDFLSSVVARLLGTDEVELEEQLAHLEKIHRLIVTLGEEELPDGSLATRYRFAHALYQNYLYDGLVSKRRVLLHLQAGEQLARHYGKRSFEIATHLAIHFERGRDFARAVEYLTYAGDNATKLYANDEAEKHYSNALRLAEKLPEADQPPQLFTLYQKRGTVNLALSRFSQSADDYTEMRRQAQALGSLEQEAAALNALALTLFFAHRVKEMEPCAAAAMQMAERAGNDALRLGTMCLVGMKHLCYGELRQGKQVLDEVLVAARAQNQKPALASALAWRGCLHFFQSEYEATIKVETEARQLASEQRDGFLLLTSLFFTGLAQGNLGKMSEALSTLNDAIAKARRNGDLFWGPRIPNCIGWIHRELQNFPEALKYDHEGREVAREHHVLEAEANSLINLGIDYTHRSERNKTESAFVEVRDIFERDAWFRWRYNIRLQAATAEHWLAQANLDKAKQFALSLRETALEYEVHKYVAVAHLLLGRIAVAGDDLAEAEKQFAVAREELEKYPAPLVAWKNLVEVGRLKLRMKDLSASREAFAKAAEIINSIAANTREETLRSTLLSSSAVQEITKATVKVFGESVVP